ncbi:hypothetical protein Cus16_1040 [Curtobacterium sp. ER1/6]|nr:hypothetical protein Cus16_1040 [Curtobacterium sp. ER1/6]
MQRWSAARPRFELLGGSGRLEDELHVEVDGHVVAEREATGLERRVPVHAELGAVDLRRRLGAELDLAVAVGGDAAELGLQGDVLGDATERELAVDEHVVAVLADAGRLEGHLRVLLGEEEVTGGEVLVALRLVRVDARDVDRGLEGGVEGVLGRDEGRVEALEGALDLADGEVADREGDLGVGRVDLPGAGLVAGDGGGVERHGDSLRGGGLRFPSRRQLHAPASIRS